MPCFYKLYEEYIQGFSNLGKRESYKYCITFSEMELLICELNELLTLPFNKVRKRSIFMPFSWYFGSKNYLSLDRCSKECVFWVSKNEANFEKTVLRLTYQDVKLILAVINYQEAEFKKIEAKNKPQSNPEPRPTALLETKFEKFYEAVFQGLQIVKIFHKITFL